MDIQQEGKYPDGYKFRKTVMELTKKFTDVLLSHFIWLVVFIFRLNIAKQQCMHWIKKTVKM